MPETSVSFKIFILKGWGSHILKKKKEKKKERQRLSPKTVQPLYRTIHNKKNLMQNNSDIVSEFTIIDHFHLTQCCFLSIAETM